MGKLKISKNKKNKNSKGSSGVPNWLLSTLVIIVVLAVLATCIGTVISSTGMVMRWSTAAELNDYKINGNMMSYFYGTTYMNFTSNYGSYMNYLSLDQSKSPKLQQFNPEGSYDSAFLGEFKGTWHDYFVEQTKTSVKNLLIYCAQADKMGITLNDEDLVEIEANIDQLLLEIRTAFNNTALSEESCFANVYADGVSRKDVRDAMKLSMLASKCSEKIGDDIEATLTDDRIDKEYADNKLDYDLVDYYTYSFNVYYDDVVTEKYGADKKADTLTDAEKAEVLTAYKEKITEACNFAKELSAKTTSADFTAYLVEHSVKDGYQDAFDTAMKDVTSEQKPSESELNTIKEKTIAAVVAEVLKDAAEVTKDVVTTDAADGTKTYTIYDISIKSEFATAIETLKSTLFTNATTDKKDALVKKANYVKPAEEGKEDELSEWAFANGRKENDTKIIESGDGANGAENKAETTSFSAKVYMLSKPVYRDEVLSRDVAYMLFTDATKASEAIGKIKEFGATISREDFEKIANDEANPAAAGSFIEDYVIGNMQSDEFDEWLFKDTTTAGSYTEAPIKMSDNSLMIALFVEQGDIPAWKNTVKNALYNEDYTAKETAMNEEFGSAVVFNIDLLSKVGN